MKRGGRGRSRPWNVLPQRVNTMAAAAEGGSSLSGGSGHGSNSPKRLTRHRQLFEAVYSGW
jgi:hypothetical protein